MSGDGVAGVTKVGVDSPFVSMSVVARQVEEQ